MRQSDKAISCPSSLFELISSTPFISHNQQIRKSHLRKLPRYWTNAIHKINLLSYYEMLKITLPRSLTPSVGFNSRAAIGPSRESCSQTRNQFAQPSSKMDSPRRIYDLPPLSRHSRDEKKNHLITLTKSAGLINGLVDKSFHSLLNNQTAAEMWTLLENRF